MNTKPLNAVLVIPPDNTVVVRGYITGTGAEYENNRGYINPTDNTVYVYSADGKPSRLLGLKPFFWKEEEDGKMHIATDKGNNGVADKYKSEYVDYTSLEEIMENSSPDDVNMTAEQINDINMSSSRILPDFNENDDFLKYAIKKAMHIKHIILAKLKSSMKEQWQFNNLRTALYKDTKLTPPNFCKWVELLGLDFKLVLKDNHTDTVDPMTSTVTFRSDMNNCYTKEDYIIHDAPDAATTVGIKTGLVQMLDGAEKVLSVVDDIDHRNHFLVMEIKDMKEQLEEILSMHK